LKSVKNSSSDDNDDDNQSDDNDSTHSSHRSHHSSTSSSRSSSSFASRDTSLSIVINWYASSQAKNTKKLNIGDLELKEGETLTTDILINFYDDAVKSNAQQGWLQNLVIFLWDKEGTVFFSTFF
jgi:hypothetical protein